MVGLPSFNRHFMQKLEHLRYCLSKQTCCLHVADTDRQSGLVVIRYRRLVIFYTRSRNSYCFLQLIIVINCAKRKEVKATLLTTRRILHVRRRLKVHILKPMTLCSQVKNGSWRGKTIQRRRRRRRLPITCF